MDRFRALGRGGAARRGAARGRLPRARTSPSSPASEGDPVPRMLERIEATLGALPHPLRLVGEAEHARARRCPRSSRSCRPTRPTARCSSARRDFGDEKDRVLLRSAERRPADLRGRGRRVPAGQVRARLRPRDLRPRRRPPRRGAGWYAVVARMLGYDPDARRGAAVPARPPDPRRRADEDVEAEGRRRLPRRLHRRGRRRRGAVVPRQPRPRPDDRDRHRPRGREDAEEPGLLRPVRARADRGHPAQRARGRDGRGGPPAVPLEPAERELVKRLADFPGVVARGGGAARPADDPDVRDPRGRRLPPLLPRRPRARLGAPRRSGSRSAARRSA